MTRRAFLWIAVPLGAQMQKAPQPPGFGAKLLPAPSRYVLPPLTAQSAGGGDKSQGEAIGRHRALPSSAVKGGRWDKLKDGRRIWRLEIVSPGAQGLRLHFTKFAAGKSKVWLYGGPTGDVRVEASYSGTGIDNSGTFWSDTVFAEAVTIEYEPGQGAPSKGSPPFQISEITHLFR